MLMQKSIDILDGSTKETDVIQQQNKILRIAEADDVGVALAALHPGETVCIGVSGEDGTIEIADRIPRGHKVALRSIDANSFVYKYGQVIGVAVEAIAQGAHVHSHNLSGEGMYDRKSAQAPTVTPCDYSDLPNTFMGYAREDGAVGTRNYISLLSTVNCSATVCRAVADHFNRGDALKDFENIDGIVAFTHGFGCAIDPDGYGMAMLQRTLIGAAFNPNIAATVVIGLGCETNQAKFMLARCGIKEAPTLKSFTIQEAGGTRKSIAKAIAFVEDLLPEVNRARRTPQPVSKLKLALQCGGSDAHSGITANPALGVASDILIAKGGTAILSETPEIYGAEHLLAVRATQPDVAEKLFGLIDWWRDYTEKAGASIENNPSYGNKMGGLTTIAEKSLGAIAKSGKSPLTAVYGYGEPVTESGLVFVDTPGYDPICSTGQIASGATVMCFTTGRGSVSGFKPVPTLKLATNTVMYDTMRDDMDINCGTVLEGETLQSAGERIYRNVIDTASGKETQSEINGFGDNEFVPWQLGAIL